MKFSIPTKFGPRKPAVPTKAIVFSPWRGLWHVYKDGRAPREFSDRRSAKRWAAAA